MKGFEPSTSGATTRHSNQLSYTHHIDLVRQQGFEPGTYGLEVRCSIQLSYWRMSLIILIKMAAFNSFFNIFCQVINRKSQLFDITRNSVKYIPLFGHALPFRIHRKEVLAGLGIVPPVEFPRVAQA